MPGQVHSYGGGAGAHASPQILGAPQVPATKIMHTYFFIC